MNWRIKAAAQTAIAWLPSDLSYDVYYRVQRRFGRSRPGSELSRVEAAAKIAALAERHGRALQDADILEVGTGRRLNMPLGLWLMGARTIVTVDLNPYLKQELVCADIETIRRMRGQVKTWLAPWLDPERLDALLVFAESSWTLPELLRFCRITYLAPGDATRLALPSRSIDLHTSYTVLEHIPLPVLQAMMREGCRLLRDGGLSVHGIDHSDHFSHSDRSISSINFLQYNDRSWNRLAGNRYMYMNRLRVDDYETLMRETGQRVLSCDPVVDERALALLRQGALRPDRQFAAKPDHVLATRSSWLVAEPAPRTDARPTGGATA